MPGVPGRATSQEPASAALEPMIGGAIDPEIADGLSAGERAQVGGISTSRLTRDGLVTRMIEHVVLARAGRMTLPRVVVGSNGYLIARYHHNREFRKLIDQVDIVDADGMPLILASRLLARSPLLERVATTDFIHDAAGAAARHGIRFYFLGAKPGIAQNAADRLCEAHPGLQIVGVRHGYFEPEDVAEICAEIVSAGTDVLWLGLGCPRQERFAIENRARLGGLAWVRTCGGLFDHVGAEVPRAPMWLQRIGMEWLHRAMLEPRRLGRRYLLTNPLAVFHLLTKTR